MLRKRYALNHRKEKQVPTVFVTHEDPRLDYSPAFKWGERMVAVFPPGAGQITLSPQSALANARRVMQTMTREDFLVLVGDPVMIGLCVAVAAELVGRVRMLRWDKRTLSYVPVEVDFIHRGVDAPYAATAPHN
jgi:hypothetical protein